MSQASSTAGARVTGAFNVDRASGGRQAGPVHVDVVRVARVTGATSAADVDGASGWTVQAGGRCEWADRAKRLVPYIEK